MKLKNTLSDHDKDLLEEYTRWLIKNGYTDTDVYDEPPTAIDQFIQYKTKLNEQADKI